MPFSEDLKQFSLLPVKNKMGIVAVLLFVMIIGVGAPLVIRQLFLPKNTASVVKAPQPSKRPTATPFMPAKNLKKAGFALSPLAKSLTTGATLMVSIEFDSGDYSIEAADCVIKYDPKILQVNRITPATLFAQYPQQEPVDDKIYLTGIAADAKNQTGTKGKGLFATVEFKAVGKGNSTLEFVREETIAASKGENVLVESKGATYTIE